MAGDSKINAKNGGKRGYQMGTKGPADLRVSDYEKTKAPVRGTQPTKKAKVKFEKYNALDKMDIAERTYQRMHAEARRKTAAQKALAKQTNPPYRVDKAPSHSLPVGGRGKN